MRKIFADNLKVCNSNWNFEDVARESVNSKAAFSYDVVKVGESFGIFCDSRRFAEFVKEQQAEKVFYYK